MFGKLMPKRYPFPKTRRLGGRGTFKAILNRGIRQARGPLVMVGQVNELGYSRMGISVGRQTGNAVRRNRFKRLLREAFRVHQHDLPTGYDFVIIVRPHEPMILAEYQKLVTALMLRIHTASAKRD
jgi:ribonuclease P protein component